MVGEMSGRPSGGVPGALVGTITPMRSRARFFIAIGCAVVLGAWMLVTSFGGLETYASPSAVAAGETYRLNGIVGPGAPVDASAKALSDEGLTFWVLDKKAPTERIKVTYKGKVPDAFRSGRELVVTGTREGSLFVARRDSMITLCPSKFTEKRSDSASSGG
jgi:cytochrome c-type biogenesis protein CcmE